MKKSKLKPATKPHRTDLHVTLPVQEVAFLNGLARERGVTRNALVCESIAAYRVSRKRTEIEAAMLRDVETLAAENTKILREFEPHALSVLMRETAW